VLSPPLSSSSIGASAFPNLEGFKLSSRRLRWGWGLGGYPVLSGDGSGEGPLSIIFVISRLKLCILVHFKVHLLTLKIYRFIPWTVHNTAPKTNQNTFKTCNELTVTRKTLRTSHWRRCTWRTSALFSRITVWNISSIGVGAFRPLAEYHIIFSSSHNG